MQPPLAAQGSTRAGGHNEWERLMHDAVQLLGISMPPKEIDVLLHEVDRSGTGELEMEDFTQLMVLTLSRTAAKASDHSKGQEKEQQSNQNMQQAALPFEVVALAYRRCARRAISEVYRAVQGLRCTGSGKATHRSSASIGSH